MLLLLQLRPQVRAHLSDGLARCPPHVRVLVLQPLDAHGHQRIQVPQHGLDTALRNLGEANEGGVALLPVGVGHQPRQTFCCQGHQCVAPQAQCQPVQTLLPKLIQFSLAVRLVSVAVGPMPVLLVLDVQQEGQHDAEDGLRKGGQLAHHPRRLVAGLAQRDQELGCQLAGGVIQRLCARNLQHCCHHFRQLAPQEPRVRLCDFDKHLQSLLCRGLLLCVQGLADPGQHQRSHCLELVTVRLRLQAQDE
mmetsp:Transcript_12792/g.38564  ORF Transcript_12792/g.38564 Transcript_12792/m.38564 type:complete len:249 (+) Transcript_12792:1510-2256(+)